MTDISTLTAADRDISDRKLIELGIALSAERDRNRLMDMILAEAMRLCQADGGTLYLVTEDRKALRFGFVRNNTLKDLRPFPPLPLYLEDGRPDDNHVATHVAITGRTINVVDAYTDQRYDFSGTRAFDARTGYRSKSFLTVPLKNHEGDVIGVLQLINALGPSGEIVPFDPALEPRIAALASQAAVALDNQMLIEQQRRLFKALIDVLANAIDAKSPYTGGHCKRVPELTLMLAEAVCAAREGPFREFNLTPEQWYELEVAAGLHDCGKVTTPDYVMDKATKLETLYDRIETLRTRFEVLKRDAEIESLKARLQGQEDEAALAATLAERLRRLDEDRAFLERINIGAEAMAAEEIERVKRIAARRWRDPSGAEVLLLTADEVENLCIPRGTLTAKERQIINHHVVVTISMLSDLPFPKTLSQVVEIAGGHHEKLDGTGYPNGRTRDQLSPQARMLAIADVFEALTAADRPYKSPKPLSESIAIMADMVHRGHIDPDLFALLLRSGVYRRYAEKYLRPEQIDTVDLARYLTPQAVE